MMRTCTVSLAVRDIVRMIAVSHSKGICWWQSDRAVDLQPVDLIIVAML
jgi:hypothetical protein